MREDKKRRFSFLGWEERIERKVPTISRWKWLHNKSHDKETDIERVNSNDNHNGVVTADDNGAEKNNSMREFFIWYDRKEKTLL